MDGAALRGKKYGSVVRVDDAVKQCAAVFTFEFVILKAGAIELGKLCSTECQPCFALWTFDISLQSGATHGPESIIQQIVLLPDFNRLNFNQLVAFADRPEQPIGLAQPFQRSRARTTSTSADCELRRNVLRGLSSKGSSFESETVKRAKQTLSHLCRPTLV